MQINFTDLVNQAQNGDRVACSKLYQLTFKSSYYLALRITRNESSAAQLVEASYKKAFSSIGTLKNPESFEAWIKHITAVKSIELLKQKNQLVFDGQAALPSDIIEDGYEFLPKGLEKSANAGKAINKIVDSLPACQRVVTVLHYYNEMPVSHIARILDCAENDVKAELHSAKNNIKKCIDRMINRETELYPSENKPLLALILQSAGNQQAVDEALLRTVFTSATEGMFAVSIKQPVPETVSAPITESVSADSVSETKTPDSTTVKHPKEKNIPNIFKKLNALTKKQKITATVCAAVAVVLIVVGAFGISKLVSSKNKEHNDTDVPNAVYEIDEELLSSIEPYNEIYGNSLKSFYSGSEEHGFTDLAFNFEYYDNNYIPDLMVFGKEADNGIKKEDTITAIIALNGTYAGWTETDTMVELIDIPKDFLWLGEKGTQVIHEEGENENGKIIRYSKLYEDDEGKKESAILEYRKSIVADSSEVTENWIYQDITMKETLQLSGWDEFYTRKNEMLEGYHQIGYGYSVEEFVDSGKTVTEFLKNAKTEYFGAVATTTDEETSTVVQTATTIDYKWFESSVLNNSFAFIENYNEKTCMVKMADTGYFGLIDLKGNIVVEPEYGHYFDYCSYGGDDIHYVMQDENYNEYIIDMNTFKVSSQLHGGHGANDDVIPAGFDDIDRYHNGLAAAKKNGKWGYVDKSNNTVIPFEYEQVEDRFISDDCRGFDGTYIPVKKNGKMGIINKQNQVVVPFEYSVIMHGDDGIFIAQKNGKWGFIGIGIEPKEPKKPASGEKTPEWETNYLKTINDEAFENFNFILTDLDNNGVPDLILVMHRGTRGPITTICMNGEYKDTYDEEAGYFDYVYYSQTKKIATSSFYNYYTDGPNGTNTYRNLDECFSYSYFDNGAINDTENVFRVTTLDRYTEEVIGVKYYVYDENYNVVEISESEFNRIYKDITDNYTKAYETSVENFKSSGKDFSDYMQEF